VSARSEHYPDAGYRLRVPRPLWERALVELRGYGRLGSEGLVYLSGVRAGDGLMVATGLILLGHEAQGGTVLVTPEEARWLLRTLRRRDEKLIVQLHSHGGNAFHSSGDDDHATSFHEGFISAVAPDWGGIREPMECAFHEFRAGEFVLLTRREVAERIELTEPEVERRPAPWRRAKKESWWKASIAKLRRIVRREH
jgi:hypothetical protein